MPFTLPPLALWLLDLDLHISAVDLSLRLALIVVLASAGAFAIRRWLSTRIVDEVPTRSGGRHNALLMAVRPASIDADVFLFIAAVQFPIYLTPTLLQPVYRRLLPS